MWIHQIIVISNQILFTNRKLTPLSTCTVKVILHRHWNLSKREQCDSWLDNIAAIWLTVVETVFIVLPHPPTHIPFIRTLLIPHSESSIINCTSTSKTCKVLLYRINGYSTPGCVQAHDRSFGCCGRIPLVCMASYNDHLKLWYICSHAHPLGTLPPPPRHATR